MTDAEVWENTPEKRRRMLPPSFHERFGKVDTDKETYGAERDAGQGRVSAGLAALRAAAAKDREAGRPGENLQERLARVVDRSEDRGDTPKPEGRNYARERLKEIMEKDAGREGQAKVHKLDGHSDPELGEDIGREAAQAVRQRALEGRAEQAAREAGDRGRTGAGEGERPRD